MTGMRSYILAAIAVGLSIFLVACPMGMDYPPGNPGTEKVDKKLIGTWNVLSDANEVKRVKIEKASTKNSLKVTVLERGESYALDTDNLTGYCTKISGQNFFYLKPDNESKYYLYHYSFSGKMLITHDVNLLYGGIDAVKSTETYRSQIEQSLKNDSCLKSKSIWSKKAAKK